MSGPQAALERVLGRPAKLLEVWTGSFEETLDLANHVGVTWIWVVLLDMFSVSSSGCDVTRATPTSVLHG